MLLTKYMLATVVSKVRMAAIDSGNQLVSLGLPIRQYVKADYATAF